MKPGGVVYSRKQTCHYLGNGHYIVVRAAWAGQGWLIEERTAFYGSRILDRMGSRAEADLLAAMYAAARGVYTGKAA